MAPKKSPTYEQFHAKAVQFMPDIPIKATSTWIAILIHLLKDPKEIKQKNDFLWIRCHSRITVRTLKHEYFQRHPLDGFELKYDRVLPEHLNTVRMLREASSFKENVIVLQAVEQEDLNLEDGIAARRKYVNFDRGNIENPLIIDEDDEDDHRQQVQANVCKPNEIDQVPQGVGNFHDIKHDPAHKDSGVSDFIGNANGKEQQGVKHTQYEEDSDANLTMSKTGDPAAEDGSVGLKRKYSAVDETNGETLDETRLDDQPDCKGEDEMSEGCEPTHDLSPRLDEAASISPPGGKTTIKAGDISENSYFSRSQWADYCNRVSTIGSPTLAERYFDISQLHACDNCGRHLFAKPWTRFTASSGPMCTFCTRDFLKNHGLKDELRKLYNMSREEFAEKHVRQNSSNFMGQNFDEDAPLDYEDELLPGNRHGDIRAGPSFAGGSEFESNDFDSFYGTSGNGTRGDGNETDNGLLEAINQVDAENCPQDLDMMHFDNAWDNEYEQFSDPFATGGNTNGEFPEQYGPLTNQIYNPNMNNPNTGEFQDTYGSPNTMAIAKSQFAPTNAQNFIPQTEDEAKENEDEDNTAEKNDESDSDYTEGDEGDDEESEYEGNPG